VEVIVSLAGAAVFPKASGFKGFKALSGLSPLSASGSTREWLCLPGWFRGEYYMPRRGGKGGALSGASMNAACRRQKPYGRVFDLFPTGEARLCAFPFREAEL